MNQFLGHLGYFLMFCGLVVRDVLWLRALLIVGQSGLAVYGWLIQRWPVLFWNCVFVLINAIWVAKIIKERRPIRIPDDIRDLYEKIFIAMSPREFMDFWRSGLAAAVDDEAIVTEGEEPGRLMLIVSGTASVQRSGRDLATLGRGQFVAEMSFLTGQPASAAVVARGPVTVMAWPKVDVLRWREDQPQLFMKLQGVLGAELAGKIRAANVQIEKLMDS